jgi:hypothetical protein
MHTRQLVSLVSRLFKESQGQDLVEYALLVSFVGFSAAAAAPVIMDALAAGYAAWNTGTQDVWVPQDPTGS